MTVFVVVVVLIILIDAESKNLRQFLNAKTGKKVEGLRVHVITVSRQLGRQMG